MLKWHRPVKRLDVICLKITNGMPNDNVKKMVIHHFITEVAAEVSVDVDAAVEAVEAVDAAVEAVEAVEVVVVLNDVHLTRTSKIGGNPILHMSKSLTLIPALT
jgi:hypothetical protein